MANIKSQIKRIKQNEVRRERNKAVRSELRTRTKTALTEISAGAESAGETLRSAIARIDKAAQKGVIHPNQAARRKSRLMRHANAGATTEAPTKRSAKATGN
jgi:small subunit ribosomal protein S20